MDPPDGPTRRRESEEFRRRESLPGMLGLKKNKGVMSTPVPEPVIEIAMAEPEDADVADRTQCISDMEDSPASSGTSRVAASGTSSASGCNEDYILTSTVIVPASDTNDNSSSARSSTGTHELPSFDGLSAIEHAETGSCNMFASPEASSLSDEAPSAPVSQRSRGASYRSRGGLNHTSATTTAGRSRTDNDKSQSANSYDASKSSTDSSNSLEKGNELVSSPRPRRVDTRPLALRDGTAPGTSSGSNANKNVQPGQSRPVSTASASSTGRDGSDEASREEPRKETKRMTPPPSFLIPRPDFRREVRKVFRNLAYQDFTIQTGAMDAIQEAAESFVLIPLFEDLRDAAIHAKRVTIMLSDVKLRNQLVEKRAGVHAALNKENMR